MFLLAVRRVSICSQKIFCLQVEYHKCLSNFINVSARHSVSKLALTDIITKEWSGISTKQYRSYKSLKKESLRDNMINLEIALNTLAEVSDAELSKLHNPQGFNQQKSVAKGGVMMRGWHASN